MRKFNNIHLSRALLATGHAKDAEWVFFNHPNLERITHRLADFALDVLPGKDGRPLFVDCIESAFKEYMATVTAKGIHYGAGILDDGVHAEMSEAYCVGLIMPMGGVNEIKVYVETNHGQHSVWEMFVESLSDFIARHESPPKVINDSWHVSEDAVRTLVASRIMDLRDAALMGSFEGLMERLCRQSQMQMSRSHVSQVGCA